MQLTRVVSFHVTTDVNTLRQLFNLNRLYACDPGDDGARRELDRRNLRTEDRTRSFAWLGIAFRLDNPGYHLRQEGKHCIDSNAVRRPHRHFSDLKHVTTNHFVSFSTQILLGKVVE